MGSNNKRTVFINIFFFITVYSILASFVNQICSGNGSTAWNITEWLVNYSGGFIRRGLRGEFIFQIYNLFGIEPYLIIRIITVISFALLSIFFIRGFIRKGYSIFILPFVFFLGNPVLNSFWLKSDSILCLLFVGILYLTIRNIKYHQLWVNILFICGILIHETFLIMYAPIFILLKSMCRDQAETTNQFSIKKLVNSSLVLLPTFVVFVFLIVLAKGSDNTPFLIWDSWKNIPIGFNLASSYIKDPIIPGAIYYIGLGLKEGLMLSSTFIYKTFSFSSGLYGPLMVLLSIIGVYYTLSNINKLDSNILAYTPKNDHNKSLISNVLVLQFIVIIPLYILGYDYGRWIFFWVTSSFTILLLVPETDLLKALPQQVSTLSNRFNTVLSSILGESKGTVYFISCLISFPLIMWSKTGHSALQIVLDTVSIFILDIYNLIF